MSEVRQTQCDECEKIVMDRSAPGWIMLSGSVSIAKGRAPKGTAREGVALTRHASTKERDFCSLTCLTDFLKALK